MCEIVGRLKLMFDSTQNLHKLIGRNQTADTMRGAETLKITVKTQSKVIVDVEVADERETVKNLKEKVYRTGVIRNAIRLFYDGNQLQDDRTLISYGIKERNSNFGIKRSSEINPIYCNSTVTG